MLAKFAAALVFYMIMWLPLIACMFVLHYFTRGANVVDGATLGSAYLGIFLLGGLYMAIGCFASALTRNQIIAAMVSFAIGISFFLISFLADQLPLHANWVTHAVNCVAVWRQMQEFGRGVVDTRAIVFYLSATFSFPILDMPRRGKPALEITWPHPHPQIPKAAFPTGGAGSTGSMPFSARSRFWPWW